MRPDYRNRHKAWRQLESGGDGLFETSGDAWLDHQAIHNHFNGVVLTLVEPRRRVQREKLAVDSHANKTVFGKPFEFLAIRAFTPAHHWGEDHDAVFAFAIFATKNGLDNLLGGLSGDGLRAVGTMRDADGAV